MRVLVCATEAGGAGNLVPVIEYSGDTIFMVYADNGGIPIFKAANLEYTHCEFLNDKNHGQESALRLLSEKRPDIILCGRTRVLGAERYLVVAARQLEIPSVVIIDEWFDYRFNFVDDQDRLVHLPDLICCPDSMACEEAADEGLPTELLIATGSPALSNLMNKIDTFVIDEPDFPNWIEEATYPLITFMSETHYLDYGGEIGGSGILGSYLGYDENSVRNDLINILKEINQPCTVVEKLHPSVKDDSYLPNPNIPNVTWLTVGGSTPLSLMWYSTLVVGMRSMALLQSALMGTLTASYQPNLLQKERCTAVRLKLIPSFKESSKLQGWIVNSLASSSTRQGKKIIKRPFFASKNASQSVFEVMKNINSNSVVSN